MSINTAPRTFADYVTGAITVLGRGQDRPHGFDLTGFNRNAPVGLTVLNGSPLVHAMGTNDRMAIPQAQGVLSGMTIGPIANRRPEAAAVLELNALPDIGGRRASSITIDPAKRAHLDLQRSTIQPSVVSGKAPVVRMPHAKSG